MIGLFPTAAPIIKFRTRMRMTLTKARILEQYEDLCVITAMMRMILMKKMTSPTLYEFCSDNQKPS
jgi:hypothetical protein